MPRQAREVEAGFPMHVTQRGNYRQNIFHDDDDKDFYIKSFLFYRRKYIESTRTLLKLPKICIPTDSVFVPQENKRATKPKHKILLMNYNY